MLIHDAGIVLRTVDYQNSSLIATLLTKDNGKLALLAKGIKKPKNKSAGKLQVGNILDFVGYYKESRSVQILKEADYALKTHHIRKDLKKMAIATMAIELINQLVQDGEKNVAVFNFLKSLLIWLNKTSANPMTLFAYIQTRLAALMGIGITMDEDLQVKNPLPESYLNIKNGSVTSDTTSELCYKLTTRQTLYLKFALLTQSKKILNIQFNLKEYKQLVYHLDAYLQYHFDTIHPRKSDYIFDQILQEALWKSEKDI